MKNEIKVMEALADAFPGHHVVSRIIKDNYNKQSIFFDDWCVGYFDKDFFNKDLDNPEIEITLKAPLKNIKDFVDHANSYGIIRGAVERGLSIWENESQANN